MKQRKEKEKQEKIGVSKATQVGKSKREGCPPRCPTTTHFYCHPSFPPLIFFWNPYSAPLICFFFVFCSFPHIWAWFQTNSNHCQRVATDNLVGWDCFQVQGGRLMGFSVNVCLPHHRSLLASHIQKESKQVNFAFIRTIKTIPEAPQYSQIFFQISKCYCLCPHPHPLPQPNAS